MGLLQDLGKIDVLLSDVLHASLFHSFSFPCDSVKLKARMFSFLSGLSFDFCYQ